MERNGTHASTGAGARTRKQHATSTQDLRDSSEREHVSAAFAQQGTRHPELIRTATHPNPLQRSRPPAPAAQKSPEHHPLLPRLPAEPRSSQHPDTGTAPPADNTARASALHGAGQRPPGKRVPWPATGAGSPVGRAAVAAVGAPGPRRGRGARLVAWQSQPWAPLARDGGGEPGWSRGSRSRGRPWPAMGTASPATEDVSQTWAESPPWARQAPPRRDVSQTTDLLDPSGRSQGMRMIMCREHPDESARRDSRTSASAVFAPVARIPCSTMRRHVLMHEDDGKSQCRPPSMGSSAMSPEPSPLTS